MKWALRFGVMGLAHAAAIPAASRSNRPPRNTFGQPRLDGVWSFNSLTRMERPDRYSAVVISEAEARAITPPPLIPPDETGQDDSETYDADGAGLARVNG